MTAVYHQLPLFPMRLCPVCGVSKELTEFYRHKGKRDGLHTTCKPCYCAAYLRRRAVHIEESRARDRQRYAARRAQGLEKHKTDPVSRKKHADRARAYRLANIAQVRERDRARNARRRHASPARVQEQRQQEKEALRQRTHKMCSTCRRAKAVAEFHRDSTSRDGLSYSCKECSFQRGRAWYDAHLLTARERAKESEQRQKDPEARRQWEAERAVKKHEASERAAITKRLWCYKRRTRDHRAEGRFTRTDIRHLHDEQAGRCAYCRGLLLGLYHIDHKQPLARGGTHWPSNLCLTCPSCNLSKGAKTAEEFMAYLALVAAVRV